MDLGNFYFLNNSYYEKFKNCGLMENKEMINGQLGGRPCFYAFKEKGSDIYWIIPFSSKVEKYQKEYNVAINKFGICDGIVFGYVLGEKKAFLVQNMCPVIDKYVDNIYIDKNSNRPVFIPNKLKSDLNSKIRKAIRLYRKGVKIVLTKVLYIEDVLINELGADTSQTTNAEENT